MKAIGKEVQEVAQKGGGVVEVRDRSPPEMMTAAFACGAASATFRRCWATRSSDFKLDADIKSHIGVVKFGNDAIGCWGACPSFADPEEIYATILSVDERHA